MFHCKFRILKKKAANLNYIEKRLLFSFLFTFKSHNYFCTKNPLYPRLLNTSFVLQSHLELIRYGISLIIAVFGHRRFVVPIVKTCFTRIKNAR